MASPGLDAAIKENETDARNRLAPDLLTAARAALAIYRPSFKHNGTGRHDPERIPDPEWVKNLNAAITAEEAKLPLLKRAGRVIDTAMGVLAEPASEIPESEAWFAEAAEVLARIERRRFDDETLRGRLTRIRGELAQIDGADLAGVIGPLDAILSRPFYYWGR